MTTIIEVYTKPGCQNCERVMQFLQQKKVIHKEVVIGRDVTRQRVLEEFPDAKYAPILVSVSDDSQRKVITIEILKELFNA